MPNSTIVEDTEDLKRGLSGYWQKNRVEILIIVTLAVILFISGYFLIRSFSRTDYDLQEQKELKEYLQGIKARDERLDRNDSLLRDIVLKQHAYQVDRMQKELDSVDKNIDEIKKKQNEASKNSRPYNSDELRNYFERLPRADQ